MSLKRRIARLEQATQPSAEFEIVWNLSSVDYLAFSGKLGTRAYIELLAVGGLAWLADNERVVSWMIDVGDGGRFESRPPVVRRARYSPPGGWGPPTIKIWDLSTLPGRPGKHVREMEQPPGDAWPAHWPAPRLPLAKEQEASDE